MMRILGGPRPSAGRFPEIEKDAICRGPRQNPGLTKLCYQRARPISSPFISVLGQAANFGRVLFLWAGRRHAQVPKHLLRNLSERRRGDLSPKVYSPRPIDDYEDGQAWRWDRHDADE